jgi:hypothetical protein
MADLKHLEFFLLRYVPDAVKEEFVNIGVVIFEPGANGQAFADVRFTRDWRRVWCLDPQADIEMLESLERDIRRQIVDTHDREMLIRKLQDSFSNTIQVTSMKGCQTEEPSKEIEALARIYFEGPKPARPRVPSGRGRILEVMQDAFERAGVWKLLMQGIPVSPYTKKGDDFAIDFGYRVGNEIKLFHAVSLKNSVDQAVNLAYRYPKIEAEMPKLNNAHPALTAVVDDGLDRSDQQIDFALGMMEEARIKIANVTEMPAIAAVARQELRV